LTSVSVVALAGVLGLAVGSFLNVCIYRLPRQQSIAFPPSRCPRCGRGLSWFDNIPVLSWMALRGRCRQCSEPISIQYPIVELVTCALFVAVVWMSPTGPLIVSRLVLGCALIVLFVIDLEHQILPNVITLPGIAIGLALSLVAPPGILNAIIGAALGAGVLYAIAAGYYLVRKEEGMGMGDVKMLAMIGAFLGWQAVLLTLILSSFSGAVIGIAILATSRGSMRYALPFGTFLALGALVAMLGGDAIVGWYLGLFDPR
jgi:leader peptidase (prepilin peptidase) / N-methyltransferase